jgi:hypothetical protein
MDDWADHPFKQSYQINVCTIYTSVLILIRNRPEDIMWKSEEEEEEEMHNGIEKNKIIERYKLHNLRESTFHHMSEICNDSN